MALFQAPAFDFSSLFRENIDGHNLELVSFFFFASECDEGRIWYLYLVLGFV